MTSERKGGTLEQAIGHRNGCPHLYFDQQACTCGGAMTETAIHPLLYQLAEEIARQDEKHGPYEAATQLGRSRLALATLEDEVAEAMEAWRAERKAINWNQTRAEVLQVAAVAIRTLRDAL